MYSRRQLKKFSESVATIKSITEVYEQAAAKKVKLIQNAVSGINQYITACADTYLNIKFGLIAQKNTQEHLKLSQIDEAKKKQILVSSFLPKTKKGVLVFIASHEEYYGNLVPGIYLQWKSDLQLTGYDGVILGQTGKRLLDKEGLKLKVQVFDLDDNNPDWSIVHKVGEKIAEYEEIYVYFGEYKTVLTQIPTHVKISSTMSVGQVQEVKRYRFESNPAETLGFFEKEVIKSLLQEKVYQAQKARYAARVKILEIGQVAEKMSKILDDLDKGKRKVGREINNKKQQQLYTNSALWSEGGG